VDRLAQDDIDEARKAPPEVKLTRALDMMAAGMRFKRAALALQHPGATDAELDAMLHAWLMADD
jgi:hypothetical protein